MSEEKVLTKEIAEQWLASPYSFYLSEFTAIDDGVAELLGNWDAGGGGILGLDGVTSLSEKAAESLAQFSGRRLELGLQSISESVASRLVRFEGPAGHRPGWLILKSLSELSDEAAEVLKDFRGWLQLDGLKSLADSTAMILSGKVGSISLGLEELSDDAAERFGKMHSHGHHNLHLDELTKLSDKGAESLSKYKGYLSLNGITSLTDSAAESLSGCMCRSLSLNGVTSLTAAAAESLSRFNPESGTLSLEGLIEIEDSSGHVALINRLCKSHENSELDLALTSLPESVAKALSKHDGELTLWAVTEVQPNVAKELSRFNGTLWLGLECLLEEVAEELSRLPGDLFLNRLKDLSDAAAQQLAEHRGNLSLEALESLSDNAAKYLGEKLGDELCLESVTQLSDAAATSICKFKGNLIMYPEEMPQSAADIISKHHSLVEEDEEE